MRIMFMSLKEYYENNVVLIKGIPCSCQVHLQLKEYYDNNVLAIKVISCNVLEINIKCYGSHFIKSRQPRPMIQIENIKLVVCLPLIVPDVYDKFSNEPFQSCLPCKFFNCAMLVFKKEINHFPFIQCLFHSKHDLIN